MPKSANRKGCSQYSSHVCPKVSTGFHSSRSDSTISLLQKIILKNQIFGLLLNPSHDRLNLRNCAYRKKVKSQTHISQKLRIALPPPKPHSTVSVV